MGQELRGAREARGWTRAELVGKLPPGISDRALRVAATEIPDTVLEKARDLRPFSIKVDLRAILRDERTELALAAIFGLHESS